MAAAPMEPPVPAATCGRPEVVSGDDLQQLIGEIVEEKFAELVEVITGGKGYTIKWLGDNFERVLSKIGDYARAGAESADSAAIDAREIRHGVEEAEEEEEVGDTPPCGDVHKEIVGLDRAEAKSILRSKTAAELRRMCEEVGSDMSHVFSRSQLIDHLLP